MTLIRVLERIGGGFILTPDLGPEAERTLALLEVEGYSVTILDGKCPTHVAIAAIEWVKGESSDIPSLPQSPSRPPAVEAEWEG